MNHLEKADNHHVISFEHYRDDKDRMSGDRHLEIAKFHALIAIAEELKTANTLKRLELKGTPGFKIKPDDITLLLEDE